MSYHISIFHPLVKQKVDQGLELDCFGHPEIAKADVARFLERLALYGYEFENKNANCREYVKNIAGCPIMVAIFKTQWSFSVPYWKGSEDAILEALQDATELSDSDTLVLYDQQTDEWIV